MTSLNLVNKNSSGIEYIIDSYPDGQHQLTITSESFKTPVVIHSRLNNWKDLEIIACAVASLRQIKVSEILLDVPYFLGSRSDRKFSIGSNNYLKDVICPIINSFKLDAVLTMDNHSDVLEACIVNQVTTKNPLHKWAFSQISTDSGMVLLSPDAGATKRIYKIAKEVGFEGDIVTCNKVRNNKGELIKTEVPEFDHNKPVVIVDDICDGGATFIAIAKIIKERSPQSKIYLIVTHGIFSKGFAELDKYFEGYFCTNSIKDFINFPKVNQLNIF